MGLLILHHIGDNIEWILNEMKSSKSCNSSGVRASRQTSTFASPTDHSPGYTLVLPSIVS